MAANIGHGSELWLTNSGAVLTKLEGVVEVNRPTPEVETHDSTNHDSANFTKEFIAGLINPGELEATIQYEIGSATDLLILEHLTSRAKRACKIVQPTATAGVKKAVTGTVLLTSYVPDKAPSSGVRTATLKCQISGGTTQGNP